MSAQTTSNSSPSHQDPSFAQHVKMLAVCLGTAVSLAGGIALSAYVAYQAVIWLGSH